MKPSRIFTHFWQGWALVLLVGFLIVEIWALVTGHPENTLSCNVWRALKSDPTPLHTRSALWFLSLCVWLTMTTWLTGHFWFEWWR